MGWEQRGNNQYYYRGIRRSDGRIEKRYFGNGYAALAAEKQVQTDAEMRRVEHESEQRKLQNDLDEFKQSTSIADELLDHFDRHCRLLLTATMAVAGFHRHGRKWRRRGCPGRPLLKKTSGRKTSNDAMPK
jgi:CO/xanthine dehydrogenase Mo-binding subunit